MVNDRDKSTPYSTGTDGATFNRSIGLRISHELRENKPVKTPSEPDKPVRVDFFGKVDTAHDGAL